MVDDSTSWHAAAGAIFAQQSDADPYGSEKANADFTRLRAQVVVDGLVANGVMASRIQRREVGSVKFQNDPQESRRVEIIVGNP